jgi:uncharacterized protein
MAGTKLGGKAAAATNKKKYGADYYARIGAEGGKHGRTGGFAAGEEGRARARKYGAIGGRTGGFAAGEEGRARARKYGAIGGRISKPYNRKQRIK